MDELRNTDATLPNFVLLGLAVIELEEDDGIGKLGGILECLVDCSDGIVDP